MMTSFMDNRPLPSSKAKVSRSSTEDSGQPRLRSSCDACASAKLKCSQDRPCCERCVSHGFQCVYGVSRKHGSSENRKRKIKPQADSAKPIAPYTREPQDLASTRQSSVSDASDHSMGSMQNTTDGLFNANEYALTAGLPSDAFPPFFFETLKTPGLFKTGMTPGYFGGSFDSTGNVSSYFPSNLGTYGDELNNSALSPDMSFVDGFDGISLCQTPKAPDTSRQQHPSHPSNGENIEMLGGTHGCYVRANETLKSLHFRSGSFSSRDGGGTSSHTFDSVLSTVSAAVGNIFSLLKCPCAQDPHMAMLYSSIISLVLYWYKTAAGVETGHNSHSASSSPHDYASVSSTSSSCSYFRSRPSISHGPVKVGAYTLEEEDEEPIRRILLLSKLREVAKLVDALSNTGDDGNPLGNNLYRSLGSWLSAELNQTVNEVGDCTKAYIQNITVDN